MGNKTITCPYCEKKIDIDHNVTIKASMFGKGDGVKIAQITIMDALVVEKRAD